MMEFMRGLAATLAVFVGVPCVVALVWRLVGDKRWDKLAAWVFER